MSDTTNTAVAEPDGAPTTETANTSTSAAPASTQSGATISMTREELDRQLADARRTAERTTRESDEIKALRAKAKRADELEEASKSESEKLVDRLQKAEAEREQLKADLRKTRVETEIARQMTTAGIAPDRISTVEKLVKSDLADLGDLNGADIAKTIADLIKAIPDGVKNGGRASPDTNISGQTVNVSREDQVQKAMTELRARGGDL